jgi:hypothetical protein
MLLLDGQYEMFGRRRRASHGGDAGRDRALTALEQHRAHLVEKLRSAAWTAWHATRQPVSVNDVRHVLVQERYEGDPRILGTAFPPSEWKRVGWSKTDSLLANTRAIRLFEPKDPSR